MKSPYEIKKGLLDAGWDEKYCRKLCEENGLLSQIYTTATRGGCWFCHNQGIDQLRFLRKTYPEYWALMLKWDSDSPVTFKADGHTVHDYDARFAAEDERLLGRCERCQHVNLLDSRYCSFCGAKVDNWREKGDDE